ncbi:MULTISPECIES: hypothetical protein [Mesorhizobium]|uniref:hypothetical protein n=1 Tax=Mesorhizobium TaxID=68287 RepID=UPI0007FBCD79|nr:MULTISPECIES: hypothetical protein [Mesorhizobium]MUT27346.1 hypothetical protein [Mesorhizobium japonicum]OBQ82369.1 hypothetical protein A9K71_26375 [Mesorhizobium sp. WSM3873]
MILLTDERFALSEWVASVNHDTLAMVLGRAGVRIEEFSAAAKSMPSIAVELNGWLETNSARIRPILEQITADFSDHESASLLKQAADRIARAEQALGNELPWKAVLSRGVPVVNRSPLRAALENLITYDRPDVLMIDGPEGGGRTHSWYLISHVGNSAGAVEPFKIDLVARSDQRSIGGLFDLLVGKFNLARAVKPTTVGATAETVADRYAQEIAEKWFSQPRVPWIVFDSVDRKIPTEVKLFICALAQRRLQGELQGCKLFLLGAGDGYGVEDPFRLVEIERLTAFQTREVEEAATIINARGARPMDDAALRQWLTPVVCELALLGGRVAGEHVSKKLVELRQEVRA